MVLPDDLIQVAGGPTPAATAQPPFLLQPAHCLGVRGITVHIDHRRARIIRRCQSPIEESLGSRRIPALREMELERAAARVHGPEQIHPEPGDPNLGLIDTPARTRPFQLLPDSAVQFGSIALHSAPDRGVASFRHELFQITITHGEAEIPADAEGDDLIGAVSSPEKPQTDSVPSLHSTQGWRLVCITSSLAAYRRRTIIEASHPRKARGHRAETGTKAQISRAA
jgi:hypothetical protein